MSETRRLAEESRPDPREIAEMERGDLIREVEELTALVAAQQPVIDAAVEYEREHAAWVAYGNHAGGMDAARETLFDLVRAAAPPEATPHD